MSRYPRPSAKALRQTVAVLLALAAVTGLVLYLAHTAPVGDLAEPLPGLADPHVHIACGDPLPPRRIYGEDGPPPGAEPVGRIISSEVMACPREVDGYVVEYLGEVVGDVLRRRGGAWVLMNDDAYALEAGPLGLHRDPRGGNSGLAVWLPDPLDRLPTTPGRAGVRGDVLRVVGVLHRTDPEDGGGMTIRAVRAEVAAPAERAPEPFDRRQALAAAALVLIAAGVAVAERRRRLR